MHFPNCKQISVFVPQIAIVFSEPRPWAKSGTVPLFPALLQRPVVPKMEHGTRFFPREGQLRRSAWRIFGTLLMLSKWIRETHCWGWDKIWPNKMHLPAGKDLWLFGTSQLVTIYDREARAFASSDQETVAIRRPPRAAFYSCSTWNIDVPGPLLRIVPCMWNKVLAGHEKEAEATAAGIHQILVKGPQRKGTLKENSEKALLAFSERLLLQQFRRRSKFHLARASSKPSTFSVWRHFAKRSEEAILEVRRTEKCNNRVPLSHPASSVCCHAS